jgi:rhodanese-related sulfurtransferase
MQVSDLNASSTMSDILETLPGARRAIFARYHLGGCQSCSFANEETLADLCKRSEIPVDDVLAHLLASHAHDTEMWLDPRSAWERRAEFRFIDLRTREEHEAVCIPDSEFFTQDLQRQIFAGAATEKILLYDHAGNHALDQVAWFRGHGLLETYAIRGGIDGWSLEVDSNIQRYRLEMEA